MFMYAMCIYQINYLLGHKSSLNDFIRTKFILSKHNETKLEINRNKRFRTIPNTWKLNNTFLNYQCAKEEIIKFFLLTRDRFEVSYYECEIFSFTSTR